MQCPLCDSSIFQPYGKTANGDRKYRCDICNNIFTSSIKSNLSNPEINFLKFKKKHLIKSSILNLKYKISDFKYFAIKQIQKQQRTARKVQQKENIFTHIFAKQGSNKSSDFWNNPLEYLNLFVNSLGTNIVNCYSKQPNFLQKTLRSSLWGIVGFFVSLSIYVFMCASLKINVNAPQGFDSYTLQALAWRSGHLELSQDYNWLELAKYQGKIFLSFPPVPTIPMLLLTFFFGEKTPSTWLVIACFFSSYIISYKLLRRFQNSDCQSAIWAVFLICGSNYLDISLFGWVWYMAQAMSFTLTLACLLCLTYPSRKKQAIGLFCLALAIGCRPLQAIYIPVLLSFIYHKNIQSTTLKTIKKLIPIMIAPTLVAIVLGTLNFVRFGSVFEFGITYLPEFATEPQFSLSHIANHVRIFTEFPKISADQLQIPGFGFAFYIANPIFIILGLRLIIPSSKNRMDWFLFCCIIFHFLFLLTHRTFGGWQFGTRYLIDLLPLVLVLCTRFKQQLRIHEVVIMIFGLFFNIYGSIVFHSS